MEFTSEMAIYLLSVAASAGAVMTRIRALERKVEKHNHLVERMVMAEARIRANSERLDRVERSAAREACAE